MRASQITIILSRKKLLAWSARIVPELINAKSVQELITAGFWQLPGYIMVNVTTKVNFFAAYQAKRVCSE